jgi:Cdc6-like AAA superfamily ATPase
MTRDNISTKEMKKAGDQAVENHKNENASSLAKMSPEERNKVLGDISKNAMKDKGTELGLSDKKINKFMDKGKDFKTTSDNALMALAKRVSHGISKSNKALGKNDVNTSLSYDNLKNASKDMNTQQKQDLISDLRGNAGIKSDEKNGLDRFENEFKKDQSKNQSEK